MMRMGGTKTVLITGASSGLGTYLAHAFARAGYDIVLHGRNEKRVRAMQEEILKKEKIQCPIVIADLRDVKGVDTVKAALREHAVDVLINNAGVNPESGRGGAMNDIKDIDAVIGTNTSCAIALCYAAFENFSTRGGGVIMNINSVAGLRGSPREALYAASKFGLRGFSESVKEEWLARGVKMIDAYPGAIATGMSSQRADIRDLIDPRELAEFLVGLCATKSFFVKELNVRRSVVPKKES
jgi:short-subunit dehydrogenase